MLLIRSWPSDPPGGRAHVVDDIERFVMDDFDYRGLVDYDDDILLLEWDIAVGRDEIVHFAEHAGREPERPLGAPYKLYRDSAAYRSWFQRDMPWTYLLGVYSGDGERPNGAQGQTIPGDDTLAANVGDATCNQIGFGMVYLPKGLIRRFVDTSSDRLMDTVFSVWHYNNVSKDIPICWHVRPVHLHFDVPGL